MRDYGSLLAGALRERGVAVEERWVASDGRSGRGSLGAGLALVRAARPLAAGDVAMWHYSSMAMGFRGIPMPGVLFALTARLRRVKVVTVLHEPTYPWGRRGWRGRAQSLAQWLALVPVVLGSRTLVVTVEARADWLGRLTRRNVFTIPVFCTLPVAGPPPVDERARSLRGPNAVAGFLVGIMPFSGDGARPDVVVEAIRLLGREDVRLLLLGSPGTHCADAEVWRRLACEAGLDDRLEFTEVVPAADLSSRLSSCDLVVFANDLGPSSRRTTLAAALAHGRPVVALDGPERWQALVDEGAVALVPARAEALAAAVSELLESPGARDHLAARGRDFHDRHMTLDRVADAMVQVLSPRGRERP